jgi:hypothetical protein
MNLGNGQIMPQPSNNNTGGMLGRLANILSRNNNLSTMHAMRKDIITHGQNEKVRGQKELSDYGIQSLGNRYDFAMQRYTPEHEDVKSGKIKADPVTGELPYMRPTLAEHTQIGGLYADSKGQVNPGKISAVIRSKDVSARPVKTREPKPNPTDNRVGKPANLSDTQEAINKGFITPEQGADLSKGYNTQDKAYRAKNPTYKGSSEEHISMVNSNVDNLGSNS